MLNKIEPQFFPFQICTQDAIQATVCIRAQKVFETLVESFRGKGAWNALPKAKGMELPSIIQMEKNILDSFKGIIFHG